MPRAGVLELLYLISVAANLVMGTLILYRDIKSRINLSFGLLTYFIAIWISFTYITNYYALFQSPDALFWVKMSYVAVIPIPALFAYFSLVFPENDRISLKRTLAIFLPVPILYAMVFSGLMVKGINYLPFERIQMVFSPLISLFILYLCSYIIFGYAVLGRKYSNLREISRIQIQYVYAGGIIPVVIATSTNLLIPLFGVSFGWHEFRIIGPLSSIFFNIMVASAIIRYRFMGFSGILGRGIVYTILAGSVTAVYFGFLYFVARVFQIVLIGNYSLIILLLCLLLFSILFEPLRDWLQLWVDRIFFKTKFDYDRTLKEISSAMNALADKDRLVRLTAKLITRRMGLAGAELFLIDEKHDRFEIKGASGTCKEMLGQTMTANYPIIEYLEETKAPVMRSDIDRKHSDVYITDYEKKRCEGILLDMDRLGATLFVPCVLKNKMLAFLALSAKLSGDAFKQEDLNFLTTLATQSAIFIENATLVEKEKESIKMIAEAQARAKYTTMLEKINKELIETREELVKAERLSTITRLTVSLQHEINNPLTSVVAQAQTLLIKMRGSGPVSTDFIKERLKTIETESKRIRELLLNLARITEPIIREYMPGVEMIEISPHGTPGIK